MKFSYRVFQHDGEVVLGIADSSLLGKIFEEEHVQISVTPEFYGGNACGERKAIELIHSATIVNAVGAKIINLMLSKNIIRSESIIYISGVPHAQVISVVK